MRGKSRKYVIADSALKRIQVDAWAFRLDADKHHPGFAPRTGGALKCHRWNGGRRRSGHDAFPTNRREHNIRSPVMPRMRNGDRGSMRRRDLKRELIRAPAEIARDA
jgi:hypothetical protein